ncbi:arrestin [Amylocystis lapponica]|nr:arrestin [Amylocystis lapponica]
MSFILTRPPSRGEAPPQEEDSLSAALHAALQSFTSPSHQQPSHPAPHMPYDPDQHREKGEKFAPTLDIVVNSDILSATSCSTSQSPQLSRKSSFSSEARPDYPLSLSSSQLTYLGNRAHSHTLKAGRHLFPFQLQIGGSLPSSISTTALGGASVQYKLRATAVRPGFGITHRDLQATCPISIMRSFTSEALEYQQTLEIENTWPEKLMYSIMIPHKAWAAGEQVTAVGARVLNVTTTINETTKLYARQGIDTLLHHGHTPYRHSTTTSTPASPPLTSGHTHHQSLPNSHPNGYFPAIPSQNESPSHSPAELALTTTTTNSSSSSDPTATILMRSSVPSTSSIPSVPSQSTHPEDEVVIRPIHPPPASDSDIDIAASSDVVTTLSITVPLHATPSHSLEPIQVSHRIRWSILIGNHDGHTSELRCSLPLHVLDNHLYDEARAATLATRRLLLGAQDVEGGSAVGVHGEESAEDDMELPSYPAHVRDRVANAYLPEAAVMRVVNPWVMQGVSPTIVQPLSETENSSGVQSPAGLETWAIPSGAPVTAPTRHHLPHEPPPGAQPLEWVNTELLLSLSREAPEAPLPPTQHVTPPSRTPPADSAAASQHGSRPTSRHGSRFPSRRPSRTPSPGFATGVAALGTQGHAGETFVHSGSTASRNMHGLFNIAMKPFTSLTSTFSLGARNASHSNLHSLHGHSLSSGTPSAAASTANLHALTHNGEPPPPAPMTSPQLLHRAFTEVPDYDMASRGFLGGGITPLTSMRGLPSYEAAEAERSAEQRSFSDTDLAGMFAGAARRGVPPGPRNASTTQLMGASS